MAQLDIHQVSRLIGRHERTVRAYLAAGTFPRPVDRRGRGYLARDYWNREEVEDWQRERQGQDSQDGQGQAA